MSTQNFLQSVMICIRIGFSIFLDEDVANMARTVCIDLVQRIEREKDSSSI